MKVGMVPKLRAGRDAATCPNCNKKLGSSTYSSGSTALCSPQCRNTWEENGRPAPVVKAKKVAKTGLEGLSPSDLRNPTILNYFKRK